MIEYFTEFQTREIKFEFREILESKIFVREAYSSLRILPTTKQRAAHAQAVPARAFFCRTNCLPYSDCARENAGGTDRPLWSPFRSPTKRTEPYQTTG